MESITQNALLADHLRLLRSSRGLTLQALAESSGVSRASLSRIENAEVSPTAETLGRLATAFGVPLSQLLAPLEPSFAPLISRDEQTIWVDEVNGLTRRMLSPPSDQLKVEVIECKIAPHKRIAYDRPAFAGHEHHLVMISGALTLTIEGQSYELKAGDCLRYQLRGASVFETSTQAAVYILAMA